MFGRSNPTQNPLYYSFFPSFFYCPHFLKSVQLVTADICIHTFSTFTALFPYGVFALKQDRPMLSPPKIKLKKQKILLYTQGHTCSQTDTKLLPLLAHQIASNIALPKHSSNYTKINEYSKTYREKSIQ